VAHFYKNEMKNDFNFKVADFGPKSTLKSGFY